MKPIRLHQRIIAIVTIVSATVSLTGCIGGRSTDAPPPVQAAVAVQAEHYRLNRCGNVADTPCVTDADCPDRGPCVSVLLSDAGAYGRDGGHTVVIGDRVLWQFGDSFTDAGLLSATAAWSDTADPFSLRDATDAEGKPVQFLPFTDEERAFNAAHENPPACCSDSDGCPSTQPYCHCPAATDCTSRIALWPGDGTEIRSGSAWVYYDRQIVGTAPYDFRDAGVGLARVEVGAASAQRLLNADGSPLLIFNADEPHFIRGLHVIDESESHFYLYAYVNRRDCIVDIIAARVPVPHMAARAHYRFWNGANWVADLRDAQPILEGIAGGLGTVVPNDHVNGYLAVWNDICTGGSTLIVRTAPAPEGPWSEGIAVPIATLGAKSDAYYGTVQPSFSRGRDLVVSYFQPLDVVDGQMRLLRLTLP